MLRRVYYFAVWYTSGRAWIPVRWYPWWDGNRYPVTVCRNILIIRLRNISSGQDKSPQLMRQWEDVTRECRDTGIPTSLRSWTKSLTLALAISCPFTFKLPVSIDSKAFMVHMLIFQNLKGPNRTTTWPFSISKLILPRAWYQRWIFFNIFIFNKSHNYLLLNCHIL